jgi:hypothetical protein
MIDEQTACRSAVEALRSGVPSRTAVAQLGTTRHDIEDAFRSHLNLTKDGQGCAAISVAADFGGGKSHLLNHLRNVAESLRFVASYVVVSPETPLGNSHVMLKSIAENARAPGREGKALRELSLNVDAEACADLRTWAHDADISERFRAILHIFEAFGTDEELRFQIIEDLEGKPLLKAVVKEKLKELRELGSYTMKWPKNQLLAHDRVRVFARFARACGCAGLVVFIDELERIGRFSKTARRAAYQELAWWSEVAAQEGAYILPVFAATDAFVEATVRDDETALRFDQFQQQGMLQIDAALKGIELLKSFQFKLAPPEADERAAIRYKVKTIYEKAYDIAVPDPPRSISDTTIRSEIRRWITLWDLHRYDPSYVPDIVVGDVELGSEEIEEEVLRTDDQG